MINAVTLLPGADNIKSVYTRLMKGKRADFVCLSTGYNQVLGSWYDKEFEPRMLSGLTTREVVADTKNNRDYATKKGSKNQTRFITGAAESDLILGDDFAAIVSFNPDKPYAVVIEDETIVTSARTWFEAIWQSAAR